MSSSTPAVPAPCPRHGLGPCLCEASHRLRRPAGRPRRLPQGGTAGSSDRGAPLGPAPVAAIGGHFATTVLPRGLPLPAAAAYSGVSVRALWRLIADGLLRPVRVPGTRRTLLLRDDLDELLLAHRAGEEALRETAP
jgi:hypothetical protein